MTATIQLPDTTSLLPPNATRFQRDLESANSITGSTVQAIERIKTVKSDPPDNVLYWLIWEYGLGDLLDYIFDLKLLINEGLKWQRFRGTPDSLKLALGWIGIHDTEIEEEVPGLYFYQFQIKLLKIPTRAQIDNIINLAQLSAPVRSRLSRLFNTEYDKRRLILSHPNGQGEFGFLLSDYSGCPYKDIRLSFGRISGTSMTFDASLVKNSQLRAFKIKLNPLDYPVLGDMIISDTPIPNHKSAIHRWSTIRFTHPGGTPISLAGLDWFGTWGKRTWEEPGFISIGIRQLTTLSFFHQFPEPSSGKRRFTTHTYRIPIGDPGLKRVQERTHSREEQIPTASTGTLRHTTRGYRLSYSGITSETQIKKTCGIQAACPVDSSNPPRVITRRLVSSQLKQNGIPFAVTGSNWFGSWSTQRTWASPLFTNIGVIHHGYTN